MKKHMISTAIAVAFSAGIATAQEFKGDITLGYSAFWDETDLNTLSGTGSFEFGVTDQASVQVDVGLYGFGFVGLEGTNLVLHGIYDVNPQGSLGLFLGVDSAEGEQQEFYGLEYGQAFGAGSVEGYVARGEDSGVDGTVIGVEGLFAVNNSFGIGVKYDNADFGGALDAQRFGVKGNYTVGQGTSVFAEIGSAKYDDGVTRVSEPFVGIGLSFNLGEGKATFGQRSQFALFPGL
jgi:hypothetical protein